MYTGLWKRQSIRIDEDEPQESATVLWLQAGSHFADLRIPFERPTLLPGQSLDTLPAERLRQFADLLAFGGTTESTETRIRWSHHLDFRPGFGSVDEGSVFWQDGALIEDGSFPVPGGTRHYREVWIPQPLGQGDLLVLALQAQLDAATGQVSRPSGLLVIVGGHFIHLYDDRGYPPDYTLPEMAELSEPELRRLMRFVGDYGWRHPEDGRLEIRLSVDPGRVGQNLAAQATWEEGHWIDRAHERYERHWDVVLASSLAGPGGPPLRTSP